MCELCTSVNAIVRVRKKGSKVEREMNENNVEATDVKKMYNNYKNEIYVCNNYVYDACVTVLSTSLNADLLMTQDNKQINERF